MKSFFTFRTLASRLTLSAIIILGFASAMLFTLVVGQENVTMQYVNTGITIIVSGILFVASIIINHAFINIPLKKINELTQQLTKGDLESRYISNHIYDDYVKLVIDSFNSLATEFENLEQMRKNFIANASHELRSPLTSMQGFVQGVLDGTIPQSESHKYLNVVLSETKRLTNMIASMLDLSRIESGKFPIKKSRFEINETIRRILIKFEPHISKKDITLNIGFASEYTYVYADKSKIEQVIVNLVDNAIKYSPSSTSIQVTTHIHGNKLYISIKDEGIGISKKDQMLIWDRFYMADKARTPGKAKGTGLGLAIVKKIIDDHKEIIWVESNKGEGTTFLFTLDIFNPSLHDTTPLIQKT